MTTKYFIALLLLISAFSIKCGFADETPLKIAILSSSDQQTIAYTKMISQYEAATRNNVELSVFSDINFKKSIREWIELGTYDVLYWQAGDRLKQLVNNQDIVELSDLISVKDIQQQYQANALDVVSYDQHIYALPLGHYIWGFYYNKKIFNRLSLAPPRTWNEFKQLNQTLKENGVVPLVQATADLWPVLAWLDYLSLKTAGTNFRHALIEGRTGKKEPFKALKEAFHYLVTEDLFFAPEHTWRWEQTIPAVVRKQAAMTLSGQFAEEQIKKIDDQNIGFFPFPNFQLGHDEIEVAPMEVLIVPRSSNKFSQISSFLNFLVDYMAVDSLAEQLGWLSVSKQPMLSTSVSSRVTRAQQQVDKAATLVQYFDREAVPSISEAWANAIISDIRNGNTDSISEIEAHILKAQESKSTAVVDDKKLMNFSTLQGKGSYFFSGIMDKVYKSLGYKIAVNRFSTSDAVIKSLAFGADGDLVRVVDIPQLSALAIKVPEPIVQSRVYLVGGPGKSCQLNGTKLPKGSTIAYGIDAPVLVNTIKNLEPVTAELMSSLNSWEALNSGEISHLLMFETDLYSKRSKLETLCIQMLQRIPSYHFLSKKHSAMVSDVSDAIKQYKKTDEYKAYLEEFGFGVLPDRK